jgi:hypothetical protein
MANTIDGGTPPTAHMSIQAMIVRAQRHADQTGKSIGVSYDLAKDVIGLVDLTTVNLAALDTASALRARFFRIVTPASNTGCGHAATGRTAECR